MATIKQAIYNLQRAADYYQGGGASIIQPSDANWIDGGNKRTLKLELQSNEKVTKIGIQAPQKTQFYFNDDATNKFIVGRSGIWEIEDPQGNFGITKIVFYKPQVIDKTKTITLNSDDEKTVLNELTRTHTNNLEALNNISDDGFDESDKDFTPYIEGETITIKLTDYWTVYTELQNYYNAAYSEAYLNYKKALYGQYSITSDELSNIIVDYKCEVLK